MTKLISLDDMPKEAKIMLLKELGYDSDGIYVLKDGVRFVDRYTEDEVKIENMLILPGSTIILDNNELSIASYLEEFGDVF
ncbi:MAG: hypothetical protein KC589_10195 [Nanoarchaeota archaeon]|nr:hypothetical protein [Nanoarchaeota archaeon]